MRRPPAAAHPAAIPSWLLLTATVGPVALIGGWSLAQRRQPASYRPARDTISALAARGAVDPQIMTVAILVLGLCYLLTAAGFIELGRPARVLLGIGGAATVAVAAFAQPSPGHVPAATTAFVALALWPALSSNLRRSIGIACSIGLLILLGWLGLELQGGQLLGLSERLLAAAEAVFPLVIAAITRWRPGGLRA